MILQNKNGEQFRVFSNKYCHYLLMAISLQDNETIVFIFTTLGKYYEVVDGEIVEELSIITIC